MLQLRPSATGIDLTNVPARHDIAREGVSGSATELPHAAAIRRAFGSHDVSSLRAYTDARAAAASERLGARAYAFGDRIAFRHPPSLFTAAHEAAHAIQQRRGISGSDAGRDGAHERHADAVAARVVRGEPADKLLDSPPASAPPPLQQQDEPTLTPSMSKGKVSVYAYEEGGKKTWIDPFKIAFLGGEGFGTLLAARAKGFTTFAGIFVLAQASLESNFGQGNFGAQYKNLFSLMGGPAKNKGTAHGHLQSFPSYEAGFDAYTATLARKWPTTVDPATGLFTKDTFTPDDINKAFHQKNYWGTGAYLGDKSRDYGRDLFRRMEFICGPLLAIARQKQAENKKALADAIAGARATGRYGANPEVPLGDADAVAAANHMVEVCMKFDALYADIVPKIGTARSAIPGLLAGGGKAARAP
ncbi:MAG TPA: DUF4157 domain-containing protein [Rhizomicrobium sp.]|nr:DUF4157 domain-containing protein [Rhizomicrobium sp.]